MKKLCRENYCFYIVKVNGGIEDWKPYLVCCLIWEKDGEGIRKQIHEKSQDLKFW